MWLDAEQKASDSFTELVPFATAGIPRLKLQKLAPAPVVQARPVKMLFELRLMPKKESPILARQLCPIAEFSKLGLLGQ